jgi:hypothetical protein
MIGQPSTHERLLRQSRWGTMHPQPLTPSAGAPAPRPTHQARSVWYIGLDSRRGPDWGALPPPLWSHAEGSRQTRPSPGEAGLATCRCPVTSDQAEGQLGGERHESKSPSACAAGPGLHPSGLRQPRSDRWPASVTDRQGCIDEDVQPSASDCVSSHVHDRDSSIADRLADLDQDIDAHPHCNADPNAHTHSHSTP